jgi:hypothetical protein
MDTKNIKEGVGCNTQLKKKRYTFGALYTKNTEEGWGATCNK